MRHETRSAFKATFSPFLNRAALAGKAAVEQMADDLRVFAANAGCAARANSERVWP